MNIRKGLTVNIRKGFVVLAALACWTVQATPVAVDFSVLGNTTVNISSSTTAQGYTIGDITFRYDDFGNATDFAQVDNLGIFGPTAGSLIFDAASPAISLNLDFAILFATNQVSDGLFISFKRNGTVVSNMLVAATVYVPYDLANPSLGGDAHGTLAYSGPSFDKADMYFSTDGACFAVPNITYELEPPMLAITVASEVDEEDDPVDVVTLTITGPPNSVNEIQRTTNLVSGVWLPVATLSNFTGNYTYYETNRVENVPQVFFRTR